MESPAIIQKRAEKEFDVFCEQLRRKDINIQIFDDLPYPPKKDALFPNNWITTLPNGHLTIHPMMAKNRRLERRKDIIEWIENNFEVKHYWDLSSAEEDGKALEGTGSMVFDHLQRKAYACLSDRTNQDLFCHYCEKVGYQGMHFNAYDQDGKPIYHTNVMMFIGRNHAVVCLDSIDNNEERKALKASLNESSKIVLEINQEQMKSFCGNILEIQNKNRNPFIILSKTAQNAFRDDQLETLGESAELIIADIPTIENVGGGGVRCMISEIFLSLS